MSETGGHLLQGEGVFHTNDDGSIVVSVLTAQDCGQCGHPARTFINRHGRTVCVACDATNNPPPAVPPGAAAQRAHDHGKPMREAEAEAERERAYDKSVRQSLPWHHEATAAEACTWGLQQWGHLTILFAVACRDRNPEKLRDVCNDLRRIVTRMDAYRRMKERQWSGVEKPKPKGKEQAK